MEFGFLANKSRFFNEGVEINPLPDVDQVISNVFQFCNISEGWIYPPTVKAKKSLCEINSKDFEVSSNYYTLPSTHSINIHPYDDVKAKFIILGLGFFFGVYLSPKSYYKIGKTPYREGMLTGMIPVGDDIDLALYYLSSFYDKNPQRRKAMFSVIHWFLLGQSYEYPWDRFDAQYKVLDRIYKLSRITGCSHADRPNRLSEKYGIELPNWANKNDSKKSRIATLRNDLVHEAVYAGEPIGFSHPDENYDVEFTSFNAKLIAAVLGVKAKGLAGSSQGREYRAWDIYT